MTSVVISDINQRPLMVLQNASNIKWRSALNSIGYASFDLPLSDAYANSQFLHAGNYCHIYRENVPTTFANASWGGLIENDFEINPKDGYVTIGCAGLANLLRLSVVSVTSVYIVNNGVAPDIGSIINSLMGLRDNQTVGLTNLTVAHNAQLVNQFIAAAGDAVFDDISKLCADYACDFEVRPDFTWGFYARQGVDNPNLVVRYGNAGNVSLDTKMHLVNSEMANFIYVFDNSGNSGAAGADPALAQYYGKKSMSIQVGPGDVITDVVTRAQLEVVKRANPLFVLDHVQIVDSSLLPFYQLHLGDRVTFEAPNLPFLASFQGLQRILAIEYDDHKRIMDLTLGNAVYTVLRGKLHEVRLY
jgi:hypothetical protein